MLSYYLFGPHLSSHIKRHRVVKPRGINHSWRIILNISDGTGNYVAYTVYHAYIKACPALNIHTHCLFGDKLRFGGHNGLACRGLRQFIYCSFFSEIAFYIRYNKLLHKPVYECGFTRSYRSNHTYVYISACSCGDIGINIMCHISNPPI